MVRLSLRIPIKGGPEVNLCFPSRFQDVLWVPVCRAQAEDAPRRKPSRLSQEASPTTHEPASPPALDGVSEGTRRLQLRPRAIVKQASRKAS